ncbi:MAG: hypothetical protein DMF93_24185 [Acidobacteria bacterium]|nr:MAG: hypothetical protein DMF93_24185 [Acidobacteriota bacterium]
MARSGSSPPITAANVSDAEIASAMTEDPERAADALVALARARGGEDNVTVIVYGVPVPGVSRALAGTIVLALLILVAVAGAMGALLVTPAGGPAASPAPTATESASPEPTTSPSIAPTPSASP